MTENGTIFYSLSPEKLSLAIVEAQRVFGEDARVYCSKEHGLIILTICLKPSSKLSSFELNFRGIDVDSVLKDMYQILGNLNRINL